MEPNLKNYTVHCRHGIFQIQARFLAYRIYLSSVSNHLQIVHLTKRRGITFTKPWSPFKNLILPKVVGSLTDNSQLNATSNYLFYPATSTILCLCQITSFRILAYKKTLAHPYYEYSILY